MRLILIASVLLALSACATTKPQTSRIVTVDKTIVRYADIPTDYTAPLAFPDYPTAAITKAVLDEDIAALEGVITHANDDRKRVAALSGKIVQAAPACDAAHPAGGASK